MSEDHKNESILYGLSISQKTHERIRRHLALKKALGEGEKSQKEWLTKAVQKKLKKEEKQISIPKQMQLRVELPKSLVEKIDKCVESCRKFSKTSYSKKKWMIDAIEELLEEDEYEAQRKYVSLDNQN